MSSKIAPRGLIIFSLLFLFSFVSMAQTETSISIQVPELMKDAFQSIVDEFMAQNPSIHVELVTFGGFSPSFGDPSDLDSYLENVQEYVSTADVLLLDSNTLSPGLLSAGYFLDLSPIALSDSALNLNDFYPAMANAFQLEGGLWALPVAGQVTLMFYDPAAFDDAGLSYPTEDWTITDLDYAIRNLSRFDANGQLLDAGLQNLGSNIGAIITSLARDSLIDYTADGVSPRFDEAGIDSIVEMWAKLMQEGYFAQAFFSSDAETSPSMIIGPTFIGRAFGDDVNPLVPMLLPGGQAPVTVSGFGVSAGTQYPEAAYQLVKFLSNDPLTSTLFIGSYPARQSLKDVEVSSDTGFVFAAGGEESPELASTIERALQNPIPAEEALYASYLETALEKINEGVDTQTALQEAEDAVLSSIQLIQDAGEEIIINIPVYNSRPQLAEGEIELKFGATAFISPFPNKEDWEQMAQEFAAQDPEVGHIALDTSFPTATEEMAEKFDCFILPYNVVQSTDLSNLRSLDPLLDSDVNFSRDDVVGNALEQVTRNGQVWGYPISIEPKAMRINPTVFQNAGLSVPQGSWTVADFEDALRALEDMVGDDAVYQPAGFGNSHLLNLIASYGGIPVDYRTNPPTIDFTNPDTVNAIRQVLDLAKEGLISYQTLTPSGGGFAIAMRTGEGEENPIAIYDETVNGLGFGGGGGMMIVQGGNVDVRETTSNAEAAPDILVTFPTGAEYNGLSYDMSVAYISANTTYTDPCYRFISYLAEHTDLIVSMPARRSVLNSPELATDQGADVVDFYHAMDDLMAQANTILLPAGSFLRQADASIFLDYWLNRAFDRYVEEDAILEDELEQAQILTQAYFDCTALIPAYDPQTGNVQDFIQEVEACVTQIDPTVQF